MDGCHLDADGVCHNPEHLCPDMAEDPFDDPREEELEVQRVLVAADADGHGRIMFATGTDVEAEVANNLASCDDWFLDEPPGLGLWVWEGTIGLDPGFDAQRDDEPLHFVGAYRAPTDEEWRLVRLGRSPWTE